MITLGQNQSDNIIKMITIADKMYLLIFSKWGLKMRSH
jgi:hypothetical protein